MEYQIQKKENEYNHKDESCYKSLNLNLFDKNIIQDTHVQSCSICIKRIVDFEKDINQFKNFQVEIEFSKREKQLILKELIFNQLRINLLKLSKFNASFVFIGNLFKDLCSVIFSIKTALFSMGIMFLSLAFNFLFN